MRDAAPSMRGQHAVRMLWAVAMTIGACYIAAYILIAVRRMAYPFELEWMEGAVLDQVRQVAAGQRLYVAPSMDFIPFQYPPLYFYLGALITRIAGVGFAPLRLVSFVCSVGCFGIIFGMVQRDSGSARAGWVAAALFAGCFRLGGAWYDLARVDSLCLVLVLCAAYSVRFDASVRGGILAAILLSLAFLTKQSALLVAVPLLAYRASVCRRQGMWAILTFLALSGAAIWALDTLHGGWYVYYVFMMPAKMQRVDAVNADFWRHHIAGSLVIASALSAWYLWRMGRRSWHASAAWFYPAFALGLIGSTWLSMRHAGAYDNNLIPADAAISTLFGLALAEIEGGVLSAILCIGQLLLLSYDPRAQLPTARSRAAGRHLVSVIGSTPGDVLLPQHGYLGAFAGKRTFAHSMAVYDVIRAGRPEDARRVVEQLQHALAERRFGAVIADRVDPWLRDDLARAYRQRGDAIADPDAFWPLTGLRIRPESVFVPR